jgi:dTDP-4-dehydrorhamnose 3,5-epimerase
MDNQEKLAFKIEFSKAGRIGINTRITTSGLKKEETGLEGCFVLDFPENRDIRGNFFRKYCIDDFKRLNLNTSWPQTNYSSNDKAGTLRGFHYQSAPFQEVKLVTCVSGSIYDVILDLRSESETYLQTFSINLKADSNTLLYIAKGIAHAYLTLEDNSSILYQVSENYSLQNTHGVGYLDPKVNVEWPIEPKYVSNNDMNWKNL